MEARESPREKGRFRTRHPLVNERIHTSRSPDATYSTQPGGGRHTSAMWAVAAITVATHTHTHTRLTTFFSRATWVSRYQKGKTSLDLNEARDGVVWGCSGISWTVCKQSAPRSRQTTTPTPHQSIFTGQMIFLAPNQQCQSTEGISTEVISQISQLIRTEATNERIPEHRIKL